MARDAWQELLALTTANHPARAVAQTRVVAVLRRAGHVAEADGLVAEFLGGETGIASPSK
jgi:hypothetical protein